jgi:hypothetical protein
MLARSRNFQHIFAIRAAIIRHTQVRVIVCLASQTRGTGGHVNVAEMTLFDSMVFWVKPRDPKIEPWREITANQPKEIWIMESNDDVICGRPMRSKSQLLRKSSSPKFPPLIRPNCSKLHSWALEPHTLGHQGL